MDKLVERLASGDRDAFGELYDACADRLHHYLSIKLGSRDDASDVLQETFVRLARSCDRFAGVENPVAYAFATARNEAARFVSRSRQSENVPFAEAAIHFQLPEGNEFHTLETKDAVAGALSRLTPELYEVVELKFFAGLTFREIAEITELPQGTVATRYRTALQHLKRWLSKELL